MNKAQLMASVDFYEIDWNGVEINHRSRIERAKGRGAGDVSFILFSASRSGSCC